jgi:hypothetical protein
VQISLVAQAANVDAVQWSYQWANGQAAPTLIGTGPTQSVSLGIHPEDSKLGYSPYRLFAYGLVGGKQVVTAEVDITIA